MIYLEKKIFLLITWLATYFAPVSEFMLMVGLLVFLDTYLGVKYAKKEGVFNSRRLESVIHKTLIYVCAILISHLAEKSLDIPMLLKITAGYIAYTECVSIDENSTKLMGYSIFKKVLKFIKRDEK